MKVRALQSYVRDLADQNQVLVEAVQDLEKEAQLKGSSGVGMKLCASDCMLHARLRPSGGPWSDPLEGLGATLWRALERQSVCAPSHPEP
ncbi:hypothetical protein NHX12_021372, partial [Muraenolepis orangiensis]